VYKVSFLLLEKFNFCHDLVFLTSDLAQIVISNKVATFDSLQKRNSVNNLVHIHLLLSIYRDSYTILTSMHGLIFPKSLIQHQYTLPLDELPSLYV